MSLRLAARQSAPAVRALGWAALLAPAAWQVVQLAAILAARFPCPLDLDLLESSHVYHAWRLAHGLPLYASPSSGFVTFPYPPLYWVAIGAAAHAFGFTLQAGRAVALASLAVASAVLTWRVARSAPTRATGALFAIVALGGIAAGYPASDGSYDWVRSDMLATAFAVVAAALAGDGRPSTPRAAGAALALGASIYTKQSALLFAAWIVAYALRRDRRRGLALAAMTGLVCAVPFAWLEASTHGWFAVWLSYPRHQPLRPWVDGAGACGVFLLRAPAVLAVPWLARFARTRGGLRPLSILWAGMLGSAVVQGALLSFKEFCCGNVWIPALVLAWPVTLVVLGDALAKVDRSSPLFRRALAGATGASALALALLAYRAGPFVPSVDRWTAAKRLDDIVRSLAGGVVVTTVPMAGVASGTTEQPALPAYMDARSGRMNVDYVAALAASGARWVVTTGRYADRDDAPERTLSSAFVRVRAYDFDLRSLASWDRPDDVALWRRRP